MPETFSTDPREAYLDELRAAVAVLTAAHGYSEGSMGEGELLATLDALATGVGGVPQLIMPLAWVGLRAATLLAEARGVSPQAVLHALGVAAATPAPDVSE